MENKTKDWISLVGLIAAIVVLALVIVNIDTIFKVSSSGISKASVIDDSTIDILRGTSPEAKVNVVGFYNFGCGHCRNAAEIDRQLLEHYGSRINLVLKHFGSGAKAAEGVECARDQGKAMGMHDIIFEMGASEDSLKRHASAIGLDTAKFNNCLDSGEKQGIVDEDSKEGVLAGVKGTPTYFINGKMMPGMQRFETLKSIIDKELE